MKRFIFYILILFNSFFYNQKPIIQASLKRIEFHLETDITSKPIYKLFFENLNIDESVFNLNNTKIA